MMATPRSVPAGVESRFRVATPVHCDDLLSSEVSRDGGH
jgi:hypothetical protein